MTAKEFGMRVEETLSLKMREKNFRRNGRKYHIMRDLFFLDSPLQKNSIILKHIF
jgi:hypothetical protein